MPGIDFRRLRAEISMRQVLQLVGFQPRVRSVESQETAGILRLEC